MTKKMSDRSYSSLLSPFSSQQTLLKTQKEYIRKFENPDASIRYYIYDGYLDVENIDNMCFSTMHILTGIHNETVNIYSHLLPFIFIIYTNIFILVYKDKYIYDDIVVFLLGVAMSICFILSVYYHIGCCRCSSTPYYKYLLKCDLLGIVICIFASALSAISIGYKCHTIYKQLYLFTNAITFIFIIFPLLLTNIYGKLPFYIKKYILVTTICIQLLPLFHWIYLYNYSVNNWFLFKKMSYSIFGMFGGYFVGFIFLQFRIPERYFPGKFNIFCHSHQIWHVFTVIASFSWWYGLRDMTMHWKHNSCAPYL